MGKLITRTFKTFTISAATVKMENGKLTTTPVAPLTISDETVSEANAVKFVQKAYGKKAQYVVTNIAVAEATYGIDLDVFMQYAKKMEKTETPPVDSPPEQQV